MKESSKSTKVLSSRVILPTLTLIILFFLQNWTGFIATIFYGVTIFTVSLISFFSRWHFSRHSFVASVASNGSLLRHNNTGYSSAFGLHLEHVSNQNGDWKTTPTGFFEPLLSNNDLFSHFRPSSMALGSFSFLTFIYFFIHDWPQPHSLDSCWPTTNR